MLDSFLSMVGCKHMIDTKTTNNIYTNVNKCEMQMANLYVMARGERIFDQLHVSQGTPYNVFPDSYSTDLVLLLVYKFKVPLKMFRVCWLMIGMLDNDCVKQ